jgi:hypothetical protein
VLFALLIINVFVSVALVARGRWTPLLRRLDISLGLLVCAVLVWILGVGPIFMAEATDRFAKFIIGVIVFATLIEKGFAIERELRRVSPSPFPVGGSSP